MSWVKELTDADPNLTLADLVYPGSHQSATYSLRSDIKINTDNIIFYLLYYSIFFDTFIKNVVSCQNKTLAEQLELGTSFFDIRVAYLENEWWVAHSFACVKLTDALDDIYSFYNENDNDDHILFLRLKDDPINTESVVKNLNSLENVIQNHAIFGLINETVSDYSTKIVDITQPIILLNNFDISINKISWTSDDSIYANKASVSEVINYLLDKLSNTAFTNDITINGIMTPQIDDFITAAICYVLPALSGISIGICLIIFVYGISSAFNNARNYVSLAAKIKAAIASMDPLEKWTSLIFFIIFVIAIITYFILDQYAYTSIEQRAANIHDDIVDIVPMPEGKPIFVMVDFITQDFCNDIISLNDGHL